MNISSQRPQETDLGYARRIAEHQQEIILELEAKNSSLQARVSELQDRLKALLEQPKQGEPADSDADLHFRIAQMGEALELCMRRFLEYVELHFAKNTREGDKKALANQEYVNICKQALNQ